MTTEPTPSPSPARLERTFEAPAELIWELCTTAAGLEEWWAPDGFETRVSELELRPGGQLRYTMTATAPEQIAFVQNLGLPVSNEFHRTLTELVPPTRLSYLSVIDDPSESGRLTVRIIEADLDVHGADGTRIGDSYRLLTTLLDWRRYPAGELIRLYHERWEIEVAYLALRHTLLDGQVLRSGDRPVWSRNYGPC